jgi:hypothetical protein
MQAVKAIIGVLILLVGGMLLVKVVPVLWGNFQLRRMLDDQVIVQTYQNKSEADIAKVVVERAQAFDVYLTPDQIKVVRQPAELSITADYTVHVDMPGYPFDWNFKTQSTNHNVMK